MCLVLKCDFTHEIEAAVDDLTWLSFVSLSSPMVLGYFSDSLN